MTDRQPLLPTHVNRSQSSKLSTPRISFPSSSTFTSDGASTLVGSSNSHGKSSNGYLDETVAGAEGGGTNTMMRDGKKPGVPKLSRECLISEIKCYGSYMLPPLLVFGVLAIGISLFVVGWKSGWFK